jgi:hypothetical protein
MFIDRSDERLALGALAAIGLAGALLGGCRPPVPEGSQDRLRAFADALHLVMSADREIYAKQVVQRLQNEEHVFKASEHWKDDKLLPLPAQMFRMGAERVREQNKTFSYALLSLWPINKQNGPRTDMEKAGLRSVAEDPAHNQYALETLGGTRYFTAVYPDRAVTDACAICHNAHPESPRKDFKTGDVMGGIVIRLAQD